MMLRREPARDDDELIRYLLGELTDDEAERLDERSVVDDEFAARLRLAEEELVDGYASGRLTGDRRARFEAFYMASPRRRERAVFAKRFLNAVDSEARMTDGGSDRLAARWLPWAAAAAVILGIGLGCVLLRESRLRSTLRDTQQQLAAADQRATTLFGELADKQRAVAAAQASLAQAQAAPAVALVLLPQTRGLGPVSIVAVSADSRMVAVALAVAATDRAPYEAALRDPATNAVIWKSPPLIAAPTQPTPLVTVVVPAAVLKAQHYTFDLTGHRSASARDFIGSYAFEVVRR